MFYKNFPKNKNKRGFTLIEMLIVVAIIGSLSVVVLTRTKGKKEMGADTAVKAGLQQVLVEAENYYAEHEDTFGEGSYDGSENEDHACGDGKIINQLRRIDKQSATGEDVQCEANDQSIAVSAVLKGGSGTWCIDNDGWNDFGEIDEASCVESSN